jgi:hypothetical protein
MAAREVPELGSEKILLKNNNILISKLQPEKGKVVVVSREFDGSVGSSELIQLALDSTEVSVEYLWAVLRSDYVLKQWQFELTGSSRMRIGPNEIRNTIIPFADIKTQDEIVSAIEMKIVEGEREFQLAGRLYDEAREFFENALVRQW